MLVIRFSRVGKKNRAQFRIVAQEHTAAPSGKHIEILGSYDPHFKKGVFKKERIEYWTKNGAQISDSVYNILIKQGIIKDKKRLIKITAKKEKEKKGKGEGKNEEKKSEKESEEKEEKEEKTEVKKIEKKIEEEKSLATPDPAKPEKTKEVEKEEKKDKDGKGKDKADNKEGK